MMAKSPKSRLDREIDEILEKKSKEPIPFRPRSQSHDRHVSNTSRIQQQAKRGWQWLSRMPLALAYALVLLAMLVRDASPLLALILSTAAVVAIWLPGIRRLFRPASVASPTVKYWRGRPYANDVKSAISRSPIDSLKRYFDRRR